MMYLARLQLNSSRMAVLWAANPYRVHQRLAMACGDDSRVLFRIEDAAEGTQILVQTHAPGRWGAAFSEFPVLRTPAECKTFDLSLQTGGVYRFRLLANPTVKKAVAVEGEQKKKRLGLLKEQDQTEWLARKLESAGARLLGCTTTSRGLIRCKKNPAKDERLQTHLAVLFEGRLVVQDSARLKAAVEIGIGSAKGFGFGLLSLAPA